MIENEFKYLMDVNDYQNILNDIPHPYKTFKIEQYYFGEMNRIRKLSRRNQKDQHIHTFKYQYYNGKNEEIETKISKGTFDRLLGKHDREITKTRVEFYDDFGQEWMIDLIGDILIAEVEIPTWENEPNIPDYIKKFLKKKLGRGNKEYSNYNLAKEMC